MNANPDQADSDSDGVVDQADFGHFQVCLTGAAHPQNAPDCRGARFDGDSDVDQDGFGIFQGCMSGADVIADTDCTN